MNQPQAESPIIEVEVKLNYGAQVIYPICPKAITFANMLNQTTLTLGNIQHIKALGYEIKQIHKDIKL